MKPLFLLSSAAAMALLACGGPVNDPGSLEGKGDVMGNPPSAHAVAGASCQTLGADGGWLVCAATDGLGQHAVWADRATSCERHATEWYAHGVRISQLVCDNGAFRPVRGVNAGEPCEVWGQEAGGTLVCASAYGEGEHLVWAYKSTSCERHAGQWYQHGVAIGQIVCDNGSFRHTH